MILPAIQYIVLPALFHRAAVDVGLVPVAGGETASKTPPARCKLCGPRRVIGFVSGTRLTCCCASATHSRGLGPLLTWIRIGQLGNGFVKLGSEIGFVNLDSGVFT